MRTVVALALILLAAGCGQPAANPTALTTAPTQSASPLRTAVPPAATPLPTAVPPPVGRANCADRYPGKISRAKLISQDPAYICYHPTGEMARNDQFLLPDPCGTLDLPGDKLIIDRIGVHHVIAMGPELGATSLNHTVTQYSAGGAAVYLTELREAVGACKSISRDDWTKSYVLVPDENLRDSSLLLKVSVHYTVEREYAPQDVTYLISVVQAGDTVSVLFDSGWEGISSPQDVFAAEKKKAASLI